jgi:phospholipid-binding lipoprotein MlaA
MKKERLLKVVWLLLVTLQLGLVQSVFAAEDNPDPLEGINRATHGFNEGIDRLLVKPVAKGYKQGVPEVLQQGVGHFFGNLEEIDNTANNLLQAKIKQALVSLGRLLINSTVGLGGLLDPATDIGLRAYPEDFGQTFRFWGIPPGPYLVMPFLGPSTVTDALGRPLDSRLDPLRYYKPVAHRNILLGVELLDLRAELLSAEGIVFGDRYVFYRDAYLQRRHYLTNDGRVIDEFDDF